MLAMTPPSTSSKFLLIADTRPVMPEPAGVSVRRFRLARLRLESRPSEPSRRFEHIKRVFD
jgi:hypothetical protein